MRALRIAGWGVLIALGGQLAHVMSAQQVATSTAAPQESGAAGLALQRSVAIYNFKTTAEAGPRRGEEIYYFKCWYCHNSYTVKLGTGGVALKGLFTRPALVTTGQAVTDETVAQQIRNGSARMPAYRSTLTEADMADLLSYLRSETCCFEDEPPLNPRYRFR
jgi:mono/diheme cytochrome c family protein